jgi:hypothetical protein
MPVHVEVVRPDELPEGKPGPARPLANRNGAGEFVAGPGTAELARIAGRAAGESRQLAQLLGLWTPPEAHAYAPYARLGREWRDEHMSTLAATVAGGKVGPGPASVVSTAALQMAASRWLFDRGAELGDARMLTDASRLANDSRQNLLAAHELAASEAAARPRDSRSPALRAIEARADELAKEGT